MAANVLQFVVITIGNRIILQTQGEVQFSSKDRIRLEYRDALQGEIDSSIFSADPNDEENRRKSIIVWVNDTAYDFLGVPFAQCQTAYEILSQFI